MDNMERPGKTAVDFDDKNYPEGPSVNFALFKNNYATTVDILQKWVRSNCQKSY